jgi:hypothetical protein
VQFCLAVNRKFARRQVNRKETKSMCEKETHRFLATFTVAIRAADDIDARSIALDFDSDISEIAQRSYPEISLEQLPTVKSAEIPK